MLRKDFCLIIVMVYDAIVYDDNMDYENEEYT